MNKRCLQIVEMLNDGENLKVNDVAKIFDVSTVTIRKDFDMLEEKGLLRRQHGYAVKVSSDDINYRMTFDYEVKKRIAKAAAEMVGSGESVMIESGSTCAMLAAQLSENRKDVTIITNSAFIANYVRTIPGARIVLLGGAFDVDAQVMTGPLVGVCANEFFVDKFFVGTDGYDVNQGFSNVDLNRAQAAKAMAKSATNTVVLTDSSKFDKRSVVSLFKTDEVDVVITDAIPDDCRNSLEECGVDIHIV